MPALAVIAVLLPGLSGMAISAQDKYTVQVPDGLAFSEFKGYEDWKVISVSHSGDVLAVILGNPEMIAAYQAGVPGNGKPFPDGAKMAKIHWNAKKSAEAPAPTLVPDTLHDIDFMVRDSKRFADSGNWGYAQFNYDAASDSSHPRGAAPSAGSRAIRSWRQKITFSRRIRRGEGIRATRARCARPRSRGSAIGAGRQAPPPGRDDANQTSAGA